MVEAKNVSIRYLAGDLSDIGFKEWMIQKLKHERKVEGFWAVKDVSFKLEKGDFMGIIGVNGAGKSTLLKSVTGILPPKKGEIITNGDVVALLELGTGFDGDLNLRENILTRGALLGHTQEFIEERMDEILEFAELTDFQWYKYKQLSSGMKSRLAFSICCMVNPDILILDEVLSVGDGSFRQKSSDKMLEIIQGGAVTLFVGHSVATMKKLANKMLWLDHGKQIAFAQNREETLDLLEKYERFLKARAKDPKAEPDLSPIARPAGKSPAARKVTSADLEKVKQDARVKEIRYRKYIDFMAGLIDYPERIDHMRSYIKEHGIKNIALYGETLITRTLISMMEKEGVTVDYVIENRKNSDCCETIYPRDLEKIPETGLILIMDMSHTEQIRKRIEGMTDIPCCSVEELFS